MGKYPRYFGDIGQVARYDKSTRPDYLFCPPVPGNPLVGVHVDHLVVAEALRRTAYLIFTLTGWGSCPTLDQLLTDLPKIDRDVSRLDRLERKIERIPG